MNTQERCVNLGVRLRHFAPTEYSRGVTIAYRDAANDMIEVAVAYCAHVDNFVKKIGNSIVLDKFEKKNTIILPLYLRALGVNRENNVDREKVVQMTLKEIFSAF